MLSLILKCDDDKTYEDVDHEKCDDDDEDEEEDGDSWLIVVFWSKTFCVGVYGYIQQSEMSRTSTLTTNTTFHMGKIMGMDIKNFA